MRTLLSLFLVALSFCLIAQKDESLKYYRLGADSLSSKNYRAAHLFLQKALEYKPESSFIHFALGNCYVETKQYDSAIHHFQQAIFLDSSQFLYVKTLGYTFIQIKDYRQALPYLESVIQKDKTNDTVQLQIAICDFQLQHYENAITKCKVTLSLNPNQLLAHKYLGYSYLALRNYPDALKTFEDILSFEPKNASIINSIGLCEEKLGNSMEAKKRFEDAYLLSPTDIDINLNLAESKLKVNDIQGARKLYLSIEPEYEVKEDIWFYIGNTYYNENKNDSAILYYEKIVALNQKYKACYEPLAAAYLNTKNFLKAIEYYHEAQKISNTASINNYIGLAYIGLNNYLKAKDFFIQAILIDKNMAIAYLNLGKIYELLNEPEEAIIQLKMSQELIPNDIDVYTALARSYTKKGDYQKAIENYQLSQEIRPKKSIEYLLAELFYRVKQYDLSLLSYKKLVLIDSTNLSLFYNMGLCYDGEKKYNDAIPMYVKVLQFDAHDKNSLMAIANDYFLLEDYKNAICYLNLTIAQDNNFAKAYYLMGYVKYNLGKVKESRDHFSKANSMDIKYTIPDFLNK